MIIVFVVELYGGRTEKLPVSCKEKDTFTTVLAGLRRKLSLEHQHPIDIRNTNGEPVGRGVEELNSTVASLGLKNMTTLHAFVDKKDAVKQVELLQVPEVLLQQQQQESEEKFHTTKNKPVQSSARAGNKNSPVQDFKGKVERLGPEAEDVAVPSSSSDDDDEGDIYDTSKINAGLHSVKVNGVFLKSYARAKVACGGIVWMEGATLAPLYPTQLVELVRCHERLHNRTYDPHFTTTSTIDGLDDSTFSKYFSIAKTHGVIVSTEDQDGKNMAFYPEMSSVRHSCQPNTYSLKNKKRRPYRAALRCAVAKGINSGEEVTMMYNGMDLLTFLLLPSDRRQMVTQHMYHFTCSCPRCNKPGEMEPTLTGAYFKDDTLSKKAQKNLQQSMRSAFDKLELININGIPQPVAKAGSIPELVEFLDTFGSSTSSLRLHKNHWRLSFARVALLARVARVGKPEKYLNKEFFDHAVDQLETESHFIPAGHPYSIINYRKFIALQKLLPDTLSAGIQKRAVSNKDIDWDQLQATNIIWK